MLGVDIDGALVERARDIKWSRVEGGVRAALERVTPGDVSTTSSAIDFASFPHNTSFLHLDFCSPDDSVQLCGPFDTITCFSVTKWVHLNGGDDALLRLFRRAHALLPDRGLFVVEPQPWKSYRRRRKLTPEIAENYKGIRVRPEQFTTCVCASGRVH